MKYVNISNGTVCEIIPEFVEDFPDVPITERYTAEFIRQCVVVDDNADVEVGYVYDKATGTFSEPEPPEPVSADEEITQMLNRIEELTRENQLSNDTLNRIESVGETAKARGI